MEDQVLVFDPRTDRTHLLDATTGTVFELLGEGQVDPERLTAELASRMGVDADSALLTLALEELRQAGLLDSRNAPAPLNDVSRRELLRRAGLAGATALLLPAIVTLSATRAYAQTSVCVDPLSCTSDRDCCPTSDCRLVINNQRCVQTLSG